MRNNYDRVKDPVCEMLVDPNEIEIEYLQMPFAFCSIQCKERFLANPHLYIGYPGEKSPKQAGKKVIKRRRIHLEHALMVNEVKVVYRAMNSLMGIKNISVADNTIDIDYDLLQTSLHQIEHKLMDIGIELGGEWLTRLRRAILHQSEELEIDSMEVTRSQHRH